MQTSIILQQPSKPSQVLQTSRVSVSVYVQPPYSIRCMHLSEYSCITDHSQTRRPGGVGDRMDDSTWWHQLPFIGLHTNTNTIFMLYGCWHTATVTILWASRVGKCWYSNLWSNGINFAILWLSSWTNLKWAISCQTFGFGIMNGFGP